MSVPAATALASRRRNATTKMILQMIMFFTSTTSCALALCSVTAPGDRRRGHNSAGSQPRDRCMSVRLAIVYAFIMALIFDDWGHSVSQ